MTIPDIASEGADFVNRLQSDNIWVVLVEKMRAGLGDHIMDSIEKAIYLGTSNDITVAAGQIQVMHTHTHTGMHKHTATGMHKHTHTHTHTQAECGQD